MEKVEVQTAIVEDNLSEASRALLEAGSGADAVYGTTFGYALAKLAEFEVAEDAIESARVTLYELQHLKEHDISRPLIVWHD
jgi:hypothetical protein